MKRFLRHLFLGKFLVHKYFPEKSLSNIELVIRDSEKRHNAELVLAIEGSLPISLIQKKWKPRDRAIEIFSKLRIWDTEENSGVLFYLLLADKALEIVTDRGVTRKVSTSEWDQILQHTKKEFQEKHFERGVILAIAEISEILSKAYPPVKDKTNQLPDRPFIIP